MTPTSQEIKKLLKEKAPPSTSGEAVRDSIIVVLAERIETLEMNVRDLSKGLRAVAVVIGHMREDGEEGAEGAGAGGAAAVQGQAAGAPSEEAPGGGAPRDQTPFPSNLTTGGEKPFSQPGQKVTVSAPPPAVDEGSTSKPNVSSAQATNVQPIPKKQNAAAPQPNGAKE